MPLTLILTLFALVFAALIVRKYLELPANVWRLFLAQPLAMCATPAVVIAAGILAISIAPSPEFATLPLTLLIIGTALAVVPASWILKRYGRRKGSMLGLSLGAIGTTTAGIAAINTSFIGLLIGCFMIGNSAAFIAQLRFAAIESLSDQKDAPKALSTLMVSGLFSAMLGPEIAVIGKDTISPSAEFAGTFFILTLCYLVAIIIISRLDDTEVNETNTHKHVRPLTQIAKNPVFLIAICSGTIAYSVMSYLMTASPLSMHSDHSYSMDSIKWVVQSHVLAMYLPSLFSAYLVGLFGIRNLMLIGSGLYVCVVFISLTGISIAHYWVSMVLLGIGWNFLFLSGTLLLPLVYQPEERFKVQAVNDFSIFGIQAVASLSAGMILFSRGWSDLVLLTIPLIIVMLMVTLWYNIIFKKNKLDFIEEVNG